MCLSVCLSVCVSVCVSVSLYIDYLKKLLTDFDETWQYNNKKQVPLANEMNRSTRIHTSPISNVEIAVSQKILGHVS